MYERKFGDDLCSNDPRLKLRWVWHRVASGYKKAQLKKWTHFGASKAQIGPWTLMVHQLGGDNVRYDFSIEFVGDGFNIGMHAGYKTRITAQIAAEQFIKEWIEREYKRIRSRLDR